MRIFTSSWFVKLPADVCRIGISRSAPRFAAAGYSTLRELTPGPWFNSVSPTEYHKLFMDGLTRIDARAIVAEIERRAAGRDAALLCFEPPHDDAKWCHRGQVSAWLHDQIGLEVYELGRESHGCGWQHPKLYAPLRRSPAIA